MTTATTTSDADLLRCFVRNRDDEAFARLAARHGRAVRQYAWRHTRDAAAADDVAQAAWLVLAERPRKALRSTERCQSVRPWLAKVAKHAASHWRRAEGRRARRESIAARPDVTHDLPGRGELAELVTLALATLPRRERRLIVLRHVEGQAWAEIAGRTKTTPDAARTATSRAMAELRKTLESRGVTAAPSVVVAGLAGGSLPSAQALAGKVLAMFKLQTASLTTAAALAVVGAGLITSQVVADDPPARRPVVAAAAMSPAVNGPVLARGVLENEAWLNNVDSLLVAYEQDWTQPDASLDYALPPSKWPSAELDEQMRVTFGFDDERLFHQAVEIGDDAGNREFALSFDRHAVRRLTTWFDDQGEIHRHLSLSPATDVVAAGEQLMQMMPFGEAGGFDPWWSDDDRRNDDWVNDVELAGQEVFRGVDCHVLMTLGGLERWYVGVADRRLRGRVQFGVPADRTEQASKIVLDVAREAGSSAATPEEASQWMYGEPADGDAGGNARGDAIAAVLRRFASIADMDEPLLVSWLDDYREVATGRFMPMTQGYQLRTVPSVRGDESDHKFARFDLRLTAVRIDEPLDDSDFVVDTDAAVEVEDRRVEPLRVFSREARERGTGRP